MRVQSKVTLQADGSLIFEGAIPLLSGYYPDPENPQRMIPKFESCKHRKDKSRLSPCGRSLHIIYVCNHFNKQVGVKDCKGCTHAPKQ